MHAVSRFTWPAMLLVAKQESPGYVAPGRPRTGRERIELMRPNIFSETKLQKPHSCRSWRYREGKDNGNSLMLDSTGPQFSGASAT